MAPRRPIPPAEDGDPYTFAPIRTMAPAPRRNLAAVLALGLPALLVLGTAGAVISRPEPGVPGLGVKSLSVVLQDVQEPGPPVPPPPLTRPPEGPGSVVDLPGLGHRNGNDAIDPALLALPQPRRLVVPDDDPDGPRLLEPLAPAPGVNPHLPVAAGGNGYARGSGLDAGRGGNASRFDFKLVLLHEEPAETDIPASSPDLMIPVKIRIIIGEDGKPTRLIILSGPERLHADCARAASTYRWEPLGPHGLQAPIAVDVTFHPVVRGHGSGPGVRSRFKVPSLF
ncbi:MAG: hypothetical protein U0P81_01245 [Holophagaceae bacterium]